MNLIWSLISIFGLVSMLILAVAIWTHLDLRKQQRREEFGADANPEKKP